MNSTQNSKFDSSNLIVFVLKRWKPIGLVTFLGALLSAIATFFITPKYEATTIIYPSEANSFGKTVMSDLTHESFLTFGDEEEVEKALQVLNSEKVNNRILSRFDLMTHYDIDPSKEYANTKLSEHYNDNVSIKRTKYLSISISVMDKDPVLAAKIANAISNYYDSAMNAIRKNRAEIAMDLLKEQYRNQSAQLQNTEDSLTQLHKLGYHNYEDQAERYSEAYAKALAEGKLKGASRVKKEMDKLALHASQYIRLAHSLEFQTRRLDFMERKIEVAEVATNEKIPHKFVIKQAQAPEKKAYPIRSLIVLIATFASFIFITLLLLIINWSRKPE